MEIGINRNLQYVLFSLDQQSIIVKSTIQFQLNCLEDESMDNKLSTVYPIPTYQPIICGSKLEGRKKQIFLSFQFLGHSEIRSYHLITLLGPYLQRCCTINDARNGLI